MKCECGQEQGRIARGWIFDGVCIDFQKPTCGECAKKCRDEWQAKMNTELCCPDDDRKPGLSMKSKRKHLLLGMSEVSQATGISISKISAMEHGDIPFGDGEAFSTVMDWLSARDFEARQKARLAT